MLASEKTGIPIDMIDLVWGDTDLTPVGSGTMGSRSLQQGGNAVFAVAGTLVEKAKAVAARLLEANEADVVLDTDRGLFHVVGTPDRTVTWAQVGTAGNVDSMMGAGASDQPIEASVTFQPENADRKSTRLNSSHSSVSRMPSSA